MLLYGPWNNEHKSYSAIFVLSVKVKKKNVKWQLLKKMYVGNKDWKVITNKSNNQT